MERNNKSIQQKKQSKDIKMKNSSLNDLPVPDFVNHRIQVWNQVQQEKLASLESKSNGVLK